MDRIKLTFIYQSKFFYFYEYLINMSEDYDESNITETSLLSSEGEIEIDSIIYVAVIDGITVIYLSEDISIYVAESLEEILNKIVEARPSNSKKFDFYTIITDWEGGWYEEIPSEIDGFYTMTVLINKDKISLVVKLSNFKDLSVLGLKNFNTFFLTR